MHITCICIDIQKIRIVAECHLISFEQNTFDYLL